MRIKIETDDPRITQFIDINFEQANDLLALLEKVVTMEEQKPGGMTIIAKSFHLMALSGVSLIQKPETNNEDEE